jgi:hypothetical protein
VPELHLQKLIRLFGFRTMTSATVFDVEQKAAKSAICAGRALADWSKIERLLVLNSPFPQRRC